jgi:hypothetical protein
MGTANLATVFGVAACVMALVAVVAVVVARNRQSASRLRAALDAVHVNPLYETEACDTVQMELANAATLPDERAWQSRTGSFHI